MTICYITSDMDFRFVPSVLWQAVTSWLVNREMALRRGSQVQQVRNLMKTTWYENNAVSFRERQRIESRARDTQPIRGVRLSLTIRLARGCKRWHPLAPRRRYGARRSPLSEYMSLQWSLKLTTNCGHLSRIKWEIYFYKEVFRSFIEFRKSCLLSIQHIDESTPQHKKLIFFQTKSIKIL